MKWRGASVHRRGRLNTDGSRGFHQMISDVHVYIEVLQSYVKIKHQVPIDSLSTQIPTGPYRRSYHPNNEILTSPTTIPSVLLQLPQILICWFCLIAAVPIVSANLFASSFFHRAPSQQENDHYSNIACGCSNYETANRSCP